MAAENGWDKLVNAWKIGEEPDNLIGICQIPQGETRMLSIDPESRELLEEINSKLDEVLDMLKELRER